jgi:hypothetical protein
MRMTIRVNGPTNVEIVPLGELALHQAFADPMDRLYISIYRQGSEVECLKLSPTVGKAILDDTLLVQRVNLNIDWKYA